MCFALQDPGAWNNVASFDVSETATPPRHNQAGYTTLLQERTVDTSMAFAVNTPPAVPGPDKNGALFGVASSTPIKHPQASGGRRRRRERGEPSPSRDRARSPFLEDITNSPRKTPTKSLPFTPSRVSEHCLQIRESTHSGRISHVANMPCVSVGSVLQRIGGGASQSR